MIPIAGIPKVYWFGKESNINILVMELLERNIEDVISENCSVKRFSMMTILLVVD